MIEPKNDICIGANANPGIYINFIAGLNAQKDLPSNRGGAALVNATQIIKSERSFEITKDVLKSSGSNTTMMDSGGFTILNTEMRNGVITFDSSRPFVAKKKELNISPRHVIEAALKLKPEIIVGLDYPVKKTSNTKIMEEEFNRKKDLNLKWMNEIAGLRQIHCPEIELYLPLQCYNLEQVSYFEESLVKLEYDGIALPTRNMRPADIARFMIRFRDMGIRKVHLLGTSSFSNIALAAYCAFNFFERVSVDSTSWRIAAQFHEYVNPRTLYQIPIGHKCVVNRTVKLPCRCRMCRGETYGDITGLSKSERVDFLRRHNYHATQTAGEDFYNHSSNLMRFKKYLYNRSPEREKDIDAVLRAIILIASHRFSGKDKRIRKAA